MWGSLAVQRTRAVVLSNLDLDTYRCLSFVCNVSSRPTSGRRRVAIQYSALAGVLRVDQVLGIPSAGANMRASCRAQLPN